MMPYGGMTQPMSGMMPMPYGGMMHPMGGMYPQMNWPMGGMMNPHMGHQMMQWPMMEKSMMGTGMQWGGSDQMTNMMNLMHGLVDCMRQCMSCCDSCNDVNVRKCCMDCSDCCECLFKLVCRDSCYCVPIVNLLITCCRSCTEVCCAHDSESCRSCTLCCQNLMTCCSNILVSCLSAPLTTVGERLLISPTEKTNLLNILAECSRCCRITCEITGVPNSVKKTVCDIADSCDLCFKMLARDSPSFQSFIGQCVNCCRGTMETLRTMDAPACRTCCTALNNLCTAASSVTRCETSK